MFSCGPCSSSDPASDTVKVDMGTAFEDQAAAQCKAEEKHLRKQKLDDESQERKAVEVTRVKCEILERDCKEMEEAEERRQAQEAAVAAAAAAMVAEKAATEEAERLRQQKEQAVAEAAAAEEAEWKRKAEEERKRRDEDEAATELQEAKTRMDNFLKTERFEHVNFRRKSMVKAKYPLHSAVKKSDLSMVQTLLRFNANPSLQDTNKLTPKQLAEKTNKDGSMIAIIQALS